MADEFLLLISTCGSMEEAGKIAAALVERRQAACVNIVPGVVSHFIWNGKLEKENEVVLFIKSTPGMMEDIEKTIRGLHSYEVPELIAVEIKAGSEDYLAWLRNACGQPSA